MPAVGFPEALLPAMEQDQGALPHHTRLTVPGATDQLPPLRAELRRLLRDARVPEAECHDIVLATHEAVVNAIIHGNGEDARSRVAVSLRITPREVSVRVEDAGAGFDWRPCLSRALAREVAPDAPSGRGLLVMAHTMDSLEFNAAGNVVTLRKRVGPHS